MAESKIQTSGGVGFCGLLTILFIALKLGGVIGWSWFWVLSPVIFSAGVWAFIIALAVFFSFS
jgi:hypothetical protein